MKNKNPSKLDVTLNHLNIEFKPMKEVTLNNINIKLDYLDLTLELIPEIKLNNRDIELQTNPINLDNTLFDGLDIINLKDFGGFGLNGHNPSKKP